MNPSLGLRAAFIVSVLITLGLTALAAWPARPWSPPRRPGVATPAVFDEFVNP